MRGMRTLLACLVILAAGCSWKRIRAAGAREIMCPDAQETASEGIDSLFYVVGCGRAATCVYADPIVCKPYDLDAGMP